MDAVTVTKEGGGAIGARSPLEIAAIQTGTGKEAGRTAVKGKEGGRTAVKGKEGGSRGSAPEEKVE